MLIPLSGFLLGGPANLISSAIASDLGNHPTISGDSEALGTVTGIIDGTGSLGAAVGQYFVGALASVSYRFYLLDNRQTRSITNPSFVF